MTQFFNWDDVKAELFDAEDLAEIDRRVVLFLEVESLI